LKAIKNIRDKIRPHFETGGRFSKFYRAWEAFDTFLFVPEKTTFKGSHIRDAIDLKRTMIYVIISLIPPLLVGIWNIGQQYYHAVGIDPTIQESFTLGLIRIIPLIIVSYAAGLATEFIFAVIHNKEVNEGFLVTGLLVVLILPPTMPLWMVAVANIFAVIVGKEIFGGTGMNVVNPALLSRSFILFGYPAYLSGEVYTYTEVQEGHQLVDGYSGATPLSLVAEGEMEAIPSDFNMFIGDMPGVIGETSFAAIMLGGLFLAITGVGSLRIMLSVFAGGIFMAGLFNVIALNEYMMIPIHKHLLLGAFAFGAVYMATDPVTSAQTGRGKYIYGFLIGVLIILIRVVNPGFPGGVMLAILLMNVFAPLIDHYVIQANIKRRMKRIKNNPVNVKENLNS